MAVFDGDGGMMEYAPDEKEYGLLLYPAVVLFQHFVFAEEHRVGDTAFSAEGWLLAWQVFACQTAYCCWQKNCLRNGWLRSRACAGPVRKKSALLSER